eukprot:789518-Rhodomonas_salina.2
MPASLGVVAAAVVLRLDGDVVAVAVAIVVVDDGEDEGVFENEEEDGAVVVQLAQRGLHMTHT